MFPTDTLHAPGRRPRVLLLDGNERSLAALARAFADCRCSTLSAADGATGVELLLEEFLGLDALVVDLHLPHRDARSLARLIRQGGNEQDLTLVVLADRPSPSLRAELRALGVDAVVDRADGPEAATAAVLRALAARSEAEVIELEAWRCAPAATPLGEVAFS